jgi:anti-sigma-K factor RskA
MTERDRHDEMGNGNGSDDAESLLGAYVLDAVDDVERRRVERLLESSPAARAEAERLAAATDQVAEAMAAGANGPPGLLGALMAEVSDRPSPSSRADADAGAPTPPPSVEPVLLPSVPAASTASSAPGVEGVDGVEPAESLTDLDTRRRRRRAGGSRVPWILSAAAVVVLFVVGAVVVGNRSDDGVTDSVAAMEQMAAQAASMPGARTGALTDADNTMAVQVVVDPDGHAFVMSGVLPALDPDHTYQLWSVDGGTPVSIGLLGSDPAMSVVGVDSHVHALAITMEPVGGSAGPTTKPMASGTLNTV